MNAMAPELGEMVRLGLPHWLAQKRGAGKVVEGVLEGATERAYRVAGEWWPISQVTVLPPPQETAAPTYIDAPIPGLRTPAWRHQREAFHHILPIGRGMLAMDMGVGKSLVAAALAQAWGAQKLLIVCPLSVIGVWPKQLQHTTADYRTLLLGVGTVAQKTAKARAALTSPGAVAVVINLESAWREPFAAFIKEAGFDAVILDESHRVKAPRGKASEWAASLIHIPHRLALTGTPMAGSPLDLFSQFRFVDPAVFGQSYFAFKNRYAVVDEEYGRFIAPKNEAELYQRFYSRAYRVKAGDVLDLPEAVHTQRYIRLNRAARLVYDELESGFVAAVERGEITPRNALVQLLRLQQITGGTVTTDDGIPQQVDTGKRAALIETLEDLPTTEPVVVFCRFRADLEAVAHATLATNRRYGEVSGRQKDLSPDGTYPDGVDVLGVQISSGGVGIDLTKARYCVYYSLGYSLTDYQQSLRRVHRPGQSRSVTYIHLLAESTVDDRVYGALARKEDVVESILTGIRRK